MRAGVHNPGFAEYRQSEQNICSGRSIQANPVLQPVVGCDRLRQRPAAAVDVGIVSASKLT